MPAIVAMIMGALIHITGALVGRVMVALGIGVVTYTGLNTLLTWFKSQALSALGAVDGQVLGMLGTMKVGECISIVTSAMAARAVINGIQGDTFKKWVLK